MKKFRKSIDQYLQQLEKRWQKLPKSRQNLFTKIFFAGYVVLTSTVVLQLWFKGSSSHKTLSIGHINNIPKRTVDRQTSSETIQLKNESNGKYK
ncbi:hypothetical protein [Soonwooa purpurea]